LEVDRYHRQVLLPQIGPKGQATLAASRVLVVGCGALGSVIAEQLARAGVGSLVLIDRDVVEWTNLQRQTLFDESYARDAAPKAVAAKRRLERVNSTIHIEALVGDVHSGNIEQIAGFEQGGTPVHLILDGTDNVETRYLLNDVCVKHSVPWVYGACVGTEGRVMAIRPGVTPCLRCVFPTPPSGTELPTCDTAGVLGPAAGVVASFEVAAAMRVLCGAAEAEERLLAMDVWTGRMRSVDLGARLPDCPTCGRLQFEFLDRADGPTTTLCGRRGVQVRPGRASAPFDMEAAQVKLTRVGLVQRTPYLLRCRLNEAADVELTLFSDGRLIVSGTTDSHWAKSLYARYIGT
jgi:molybdopterin/thiamine biosynthesis adenylyltransferase